MSFEQIADDAITKDGGISAAYVLVICISIIGVLLIAILTLAWNQIKAMARGLKGDVQEIKDDLKGMANLVRSHDKDIAILKRDVDHINGD